MLMGDCESTDEIFTHVGGDGVVRHINASAMFRAAPNAVKMGLAELIETDYDPEYIEFIQVKRGVEQWKIDRLCEPFLSIPCIGVWCPDGTCLTVDGHHRMVRNFAEGKTTYRLIMFPWDSLSTYCVTNVPADLSDVIAKETMDQRELGPNGKIAFPPEYYSSNKKRGQIMNPRERRTLKTRLEAAITRFAVASVNHSWRGTKPSEDHEAIALELVRSEVALDKLLLELGDKS